ncbi:RsfA family transcriptional regulator [Oceanobacillus piezotolerans]|uniref:RsfA family transcriptional regulator n=1 Tax=Oceanobacillus piezotolerans TaxID=2448030 RepID=A0A498D703_9BACI|nr:RsfA family transcriptional regulator [Oceanobacillus piezotolerans]RLL45226.1 RsfA family transcriptional regulator [Oceanobacillus piezotolerans]
MNETRQDAWTKDEDVILAETVLRYIREGKTQLEAFKEVAVELSRTPAACGFRWNATIRKQYQEAIQLAKEERKQGSRKDVWKLVKTGYEEKDTIESAIVLLEKMKAKFQYENSLTKEEHDAIVHVLKEENKKLKEELKRYDHAWEEMGKLWGWVKSTRID